MNKYLSFVLTFVVSAFAGIAVGQTVDGIDIEAIKARSAAYKADAELLSRQAEVQSEAVREEALAATNTALQNGAKLNADKLPKSPSGPINFDEILAVSASQNADQTKHTPLLVAFVSLSMPEASLRTVIEDVSKAGGMVVFRGFPQNNAKLFTAQLAAVVKDLKVQPHIAIDPRLFRSFAVKAVPSYVAVSSTFELCDGLDCVSKPAPYDQMSGNVRFEYALDQFVTANGPGAAAARLGLSNLTKAKG
jgi:conjugal transfer pilus assembly protein TrbC